MTLLIKTIDNKLITLTDEFIKQSFLLQDIVNHSDLVEPLGLEISYHSTMLILKFLDVNDQTIGRNEDSSKVILTDKINWFFRELSKKEIGEFINTASYLYMPVCLECGIAFFAFLIQNSRNIKELLEEDQIDQSNNLGNGTKNELDWISSEMTDEHND